MGPETTAQLHRRMILGTWKDEDIDTIVIDSGKVMGRFWVNWSGRRGCEERRPSGIVKDWASDARGGWREKMRAAAGAPQRVGSAVLLRSGWLRGAPGAHKPELRRKCEVRS